MSARSWECARKFQAELREERPERAPAAAGRAAISRGPCRERSAQEILESAPESGKPGQQRGRERRGRPGRLPTPPWLARWRQACVQSSSSSQSSNMNSMGGGLYGRRVTVGVRGLTEDACRIPRQRPISCSCGRARPCRLGSACVGLNRRLASRFDIEQDKVSSP